MAFKRPVKKTAPKRKAPARRKSRYHGIKATQPRSSIPHVGDYLFRIVDVDEGRNPKTGKDSVKADLEVVEIDEGNTKHSVGEVVRAIFGVSSVLGAGEYKAFTMAGAGFEDEDEYDAFDPEGDFLEAVVGEINEYSEEYGEKPLVDRHVACSVMRGNDTPDGTDYYRVYSWEVVEDCITEG